MATQKQTSANYPKAFKKRKCKSRQISKEKKVTCRHSLDNQFLLVVTTRQESKKYILYCSQISIIPLVDDRQSPYLGEKQTLVETSLRLDSWK